MNKILIKNDIISNDGNSIEIKDNKILIKESMDVVIDVINSNNINLDFDIDKNIKVKIFIFAENNKININNVYNINENSYLSLSKFYSNININLNETINLNGNNAKLDYNFVTICKGKEEYNIIINHNYSNTISNVINRSITLDNGSTIFNIDSNLQKNKTNCILKQDSRVILLGDNNSRINPNMYINNNDVIASHSSVIGTLNNNELFYLMTRGINYEDSLNLLIKGIIFSCLQVNIEQKERILKIIKLWR